MIGSATLRLLNVLSLGLWVCVAFSFSLSASERKITHKKQIAALQLAQAAQTGQVSSDWEDLPGWSGIPQKEHEKLDATHFDNVSKSLPEDPAQDLYDSAYRELLVGDLETAETQFKRLVMHYNSSPVAAKAEKQLARINLEKKSALEEPELKNGHSNVQLPTSTIKQFSIISRSHPFRANNPETSEKKVEIPLDNTTKIGTIEDFVMNIGDRIFFNNSSDKLTPEAVELLKSQVKWLQKNQNYKLVIEGHAHENGSENYNYKLAQSRATKVHDFFLAEGISASRITIKSFGNAKPIALCDKKSCDTQNRRVVTRLSPQ